MSRPSLLHVCPSSENWQDTTALGTEILSKLKDDWAVQENLFAAATLAHANRHLVAPKSVLGLVKLFQRGITVINQVSSSLTIRFAGKDVGIERRLIT